MLFGAVSVKVDVPAEVVNVRGVESSVGVPTSRVPSASLRPAQLKRPGGMSCGGRGHGVSGATANFTEGNGGLWRTLTFDVPVHWFDLLIGRPGGARGYVTVHRSAVTVDVMLTQKTRARGNVL